MAQHEQETKQFIQGANKHPDAQKEAEKLGTLEEDITDYNQMFDTLYTNYHSKLLEIKTELEQKYTVAVQPERFELTMGELRSQRFTKQLNKLAAKISQAESLTENSLNTDLNKLKRQIEAELERWFNQQKHLEHAVSICNKSIKLREQFYQHVAPSANSNPMIKSMAESSLARTKRERDGQAKKLDEANKVITILNSSATKVDELISQYSQRKNQEAQQMRPPQ